MEMRPRKVLTVLGFFLQSKSVTPQSGAQSKVFESLGTGTWRAVSDEIATKDGFVSRHDATGTAGV